MKPFELVRELVERAGGTLPVAKAMKAPSFQGTLHKFCAGRVAEPSRATADRISKHFDLPFEALYNEDVATEVAKARGLLESDTPGNVLTAGQLPGPLAHLMSLPSPKVTPTIAWGELEVVFQQLPQKFDVAAPDDSMSPKARKGEICTFEALAEDVQPRQGDGVLIRDDAGHFYIRIFKPRRPDHWEAHAVDPDVLPLDSARDGLTVLAVLTGVQQGRWG